jgi:urease beta subunit
MRQYRIYTVGTHGHFSSVQVVKCFDDEAAFQKAQQLAAGQEVELWEGARCMGRLSHEDQQTTG